MIEKSISVVFRLSVIAFLFGGLAIVVLQSGGLVVGDGKFVTHAEEMLAPWAYGSAGVAGLLAFVLSYFERSNDEGEQKASNLNSPTPEHA